jgi:hypothetical protein
VGKLEIRISRLEADLPVSGRVQCETCRSYPEYPLYYRNADDETLYSDDRMTEPAEHLWPCTLCGYRIPCAVSSSHM